MRLGTRPYGFLRPSTQRRCTVRITYSPWRRGDVNAVSNAAKTAYITREEATGLTVRPAIEDPRGASMCFTGMNPDDPVYMTASDAARYLGNVPVFRIILSPEDRGVDLTAFSMTFLRKSFFPAIGCDNVRWVAASHYNTEHPHTHILVSRLPEGKTGRSDVLRFPLSYTEGHRAINDARRILVSLMGARTQDEDLSLHYASVRRYGFSSIDRIIDVRSVKRDGHITLSDKDLEHESTETRRLIRHRLSWISKNTGMAYYDGSIWILKDGWKERLRAEGDFRLLSLPSDVRSRISFDDRSSAYKGIITAMKEIDDSEGRALFAVEDEKGMTHIVKGNIPDEHKGSVIGMEAEVSFPKNGRKNMPEIIRIGGRTR